MPTYIALLRGINVGGHHKLPMADLRAAFEAFGATEVATYIQSGNVVFASDASEAELAAALAEMLTERFGFTVPIVLRNAAEFSAAAEDHPHAHLNVEDKLLHVAFLADAPSAETIAAFDLDRYAPDQLLVHGREAYIAYPDGSGRSKLTLDVVERALGTQATARNWRTVQKLVELAGAD